MDFFRQWLLGVLACALLVGSVDQLCPEGSTRKLAKFTGGLVVLLAMLRPLAGLEFTNLTPRVAAYREAVAQMELALAREGENALVSGIASQLSAYIEDKAGCLGAPVRAEVTMTRRGGALCPERVILHGARSEALAELIETELGVAKEKQTWIEDTHPKP